MRGLPRELLAGVDAFIKDRDEPPTPHLTRDEAVAVIVRDWLQSQGYIALPASADETSE